MINVEEKCYQAHFSIYFLGYASPLIGSASSI